MPELLKLPKKVLVISSYAPPKANGGSKYLFNIFSNYTADSYCFLTSHKNFKSRESDSDFMLPCRYYFFDQPSDKKKLSSRLLINLTKPFRVFLILKQALKVIRKERVELLMGVTDNGRMFILTYLLSKISGVPYCPWMVDLWRENNLSAGWKKIANYFEPILFNQAALIFLSLPSFKYHYQDAYPRPANKLHVINACEIPEHYNISPKENYRPSPPFHIVYVGSIYWAQEDNIINLIEALNEIRDIDVCLDIYTSRPTEKILALAEKSDKVNIKYADREKLIEIQSQASILFLPLSLNMQKNPVIRTAIPSKINEYLISGRPILIQAPVDSYLSKYARKNGFALVMNQNNKEELIMSIKKLLLDKDYTDNLAEAAQKIVTNSRNSIRNFRLLAELLDDLSVE